MLYFAEILIWFYFQNIRGISVVTTKNTNRVTNSIISSIGVISYKKNLTLSDKMVLYKSQGGNEVMSKKQELRRFNYNCTPLTQSIVCQNRNAYKYALANSLGEEMSINDV